MEEVDGEEQELLPNVGGWYATIEVQWEIFGEEDMFHMEKIVPEGLGCTVWVLRVQCYRHSLKE